MSKNYDNLKQLDQRVAEAFKSQSQIEFCLWVRKELKPLETAAVLHDAISGLVQNNSTVEAAPVAENPVVVVKPPVDPTKTEIAEPVEKKRKKKNAKDS